MRADRVRVGVVLRELRQTVVQVLGGLAHRRRGRVDQAFAHEARVVVDVLERRVPAHVLHATGEDDVRRSHRDLAGARRDRGQRAGAHAVDRKTRHRARQPSEQGDVTPERQALVADLCGRGESDVVDRFLRQGRVPAQQLPDELHRHVVGARAPENTLRASTSERRPQAVDEVDLLQFAHAAKASGSPLVRSHGFGAIRARNLRN